MQRASSQQATASTTVSKPKGPSKALNRDLWGHRGPRHSRHHSRHVHTQGRRSSRISGHMSQHIAKAPALGEIRLRQIKALVNGTPRGQGRRGACKVSGHTQPVKPNSPRNPGRRQRNHCSGCENLTIGHLQHRKCQTARQKISRRWAHSSTPAAAPPGSHTVWSPATSTLASRGSRLSGTSRTRKS